ncbi:MAG: hypothetical protein K1X29_06550 [Bdellovibrionales bacterium]|nr:hypothetical protein [Bdellovibrionales bacterium]
MKNYFIIFCSRFWGILILLMVFVIFGCSKVQFDSLPNPLCQRINNIYGADACILSKSGIATLKYGMSFGSVDILIVDDNSGSMYTEQTEMANRFPGFLDSLSRLDYQLAIITTDVTNNAGQFISFPNGLKYIGNNSRVIDAKHYNNISQFQQTIKRPETFTCDTSGYTQCPSGDERGIYALNKAISRTDQSGFFRFSNHLAVIILSDEDERSNGGQIQGYPIEELDLPKTFANNIKTYLGDTKTVSVHSIIIKPNDSSCFSQQNSQNRVKGEYGNYYAALSQPSFDIKSGGNILDGTLGSICSSNYTNELGNIANHVGNNVKTLALPCQPIDKLVDITFDPAPNYPVTYSVDDYQRLTFNQYIAPGTELKIELHCNL